MLSLGERAYISLPHREGGLRIQEQKKTKGVSGMLAKTKTYRPSDKEPFMNERQRDYFRVKLLAWREDILKEAKETLQHLQEENQNHPDLADRASSETDRAIELRARDRQRKLIAKIDEALARIDDGTYGYCEETGEPISLRRLEARPIATLSVEAQERHERRERVYRDD
jgi:DnaK suppressor protein